jgi:predicted nucleic acid-binding protein
MTEPRELTYLVPVQVLAEVQNAVAMLERHGPLVTEALRQLDRATTMAWKAVNPVEATDDE